MDRPLERPTYLISPAKVKWSIHLTQVTTAFPIAKRQNSL